MRRLAVSCGTNSAQLHSAMRVRLRTQTRTLCGRRILLSFAPELLSGHLLTGHLPDKLVLGYLECKSRAHSGEQIQRPGDDPRPTSLVAGSQTRAVVSMEIFIKQDVVFPVGIFLKLPGD